MSILLIEDELSKEKNILEYLEQQYPNETIVSKHSVSSGKLELREASYNYVLLDMSLPLFDNDDIRYIDENEFETFGGIEIMDEIDRCELNCKVIVITAFDVLGEGENKIDLAEVSKQLEEEYPHNFIGTIFYNTSSLEWKNNITALLEG